VGPGKCSLAENCTSDVNLVHIELCQLENGKMSIAFDIIKPITKTTVRFIFFCLFIDLRPKFSKFQVEICFHKSENGKFRSLSKCQRIGRCIIFNLDENSTPVLSRLTRFIKYSGIAGSVPSCPLYGREEYLNLEMNANIMGFLPKIFNFSYKIKKY